MSSISDWMKTIPFFEKFCLTWLGPIDNFHPSKGNGMSFEKKLKKAHRELTVKGVSHLKYNPPITRILRKVGVKVRPPHYYSFLFTAILVSIYFILSVGILVLGLLPLLQIWSQHSIALSAAFTKLLELGAISFVFGLLTAAYYKYSAKKYRLSKWETL